jgi:hypothetical protein
MIREVELEIGGTAEVEKKSGGGGRRQQPQVLFIDASSG